MAFFEQIVNKLKSTYDDLLDDFILTVFSGKGVHVEGHRGVTFFSNSEIIVKKRKGVISIFGKDLTITEFSESDLYVSGKIEGVLDGLSNGGN